MSIPACIKYTYSLMLRWHNRIKNNVKVHDRIIVIAFVPIF